LQFLLGGKQNYFCLWLLLRHYLEMSTDAFQNAVNSLRSDEPQIDAFLSAFVLVSHN